MIGVFFVLDKPTNDAVSLWTPSNFAANWTDDRLRWEAGYALAAPAALIGATATIRCLSAYAKQSGR